MQSAGLLCPAGVELTDHVAAQAFEFDRVFGPDSTQEQVFADVAQLVTSALDGYNVCIFAYGQTGAEPHLQASSRIILYWHSSLITCCIAL